MASPPVPSLQPVQAGALALRIHLPVIARSIGDGIERQAPQNKLGGPPVEDWTLHRVDRRRCPGRCTLHTSVSRDSRPHALHTGPARAGCAMTAPPALAAGARTGVTEPGHPGGRHPPRPGAVSGPGGPGGRGAGAAWLRVWVGPRQWRPWRSLREGGAEKRPYRPTPWRPAWITAAPGHTLPQGWIGVISLYVCVCVHACFHIVLHDFGISRIQITS